MSYSHNFIHSHINFFFSHLEESLTFHNFLFCEYPMHFEMPQLLDQASEDTESTMLMVLAARAATWQTGCARASPTEASAAWAA